MSNQLSTQTFSFYGSELITLKVEDVIYTAVKPIVEAIGLDWARQSKKLSQQEKFNCRHMSIVAKDGKIRQMLCMPLKKLNGWLFSINPEKVRPDLKDRVIQYQEECFEALYNYWHFGKAERKTTTDERTGLRQAVSALVSKKGLIYSDAYSLIHQRFNVEHIDELTPEQVGMAVEYVHKIYLEGELIIDEPKKEKLYEIDRKQALRLVSLWFSLYNSLDLLAKVHKPLEMLGSYYGTVAYTHATEYQTALSVFKRLFEPMYDKIEVDPYHDAHYFKALKTLREYEPRGLGALVKI
ncbi:phage antirepressor N-terminal domain-containing protein [Glaesserella parasuis]|uniref:phage antirepressor N-terminal domain-containing protein n=2 Tax=Glaesserella parasuis TaxID=738 RepID=UPI0024365FDC|nr:phage antirepressor N-terminal domain-containing protein [Glaesserella parasuis]MDG6479047.1 phage antirepressor N-terminal domain-containing protein [Glaesserella parasuis]